MTTATVETNAKLTPLLEVAFCESPTVDREAGIIRNVKILGRESKNGRTYSETALDQATQMYEGIGVNIDHPEKNQAAGDRKFADGFGHLQNVVKKTDGVYGNLVFLKSHSLAAQVCEAAERMPRQLGLSHNAEGYVVSAQGKTIVEGIARIRSVDVVRSPATNRSLFESFTLAPLQKEQTNDLPEDDNVIAQLQERVRQLEKESEVYTLMESAGVSPEPAKRQALLALETTAERTALIASWPKLRSHKPRSTSPLNESTRFAPLPTDAKSFAQAIR